MQVCDRLTPVTTNKGTPDQGIKIISQNSLELLRKSYSQIVDSFRDGKIDLLILHVLII